MRKVATQPFRKGRAMSRDSSQYSAKEKQDMYWQLTTSIEKNMYAGFTQRPTLPLRKNKQ